MRVYSYSFTTFISLVTLSQMVWAGEQVATMTKIEGTVKIFSHPTKTLPKDAGNPHVLYEGEYFQVQDAKVGDHIEKGNIVRTTPGSKARIIYDNGDQINVDSGTAYRVTWDQDSAKGQPQLHLAYGKLRGVIEKGGPRSRLQIRTKTAVMGVRGTDFFIAQGGADSGTEVSIIRGAVEVTPLSPNAKKVEVKAGYSAEVSYTKAEKSKTSPDTERNVAQVKPEVELRKITQEDLQGIHRSSTIENDADKAPKDVPTKTTVQNLETKATLTALNDIEKHDKALYSNMDKQTHESADKVNQAALDNLMKTAPKAPPKHKPSRTELKDIEDGAYERYFKNVD